MTGVARRRGQPLTVLATVLGGWVLVRALLWEPTGLPLAARETMLAGLPAAPLSWPVPVDRSKLAGGAVEAAGGLSFEPVVPAPCVSPDCAVRAADGAWRTATASATRAPSIPSADFASSREPMIFARVAAAHQLLMLEALAQLPLPSVIPAAATTPTDVPWPRATTDSAMQHPSRWSGDGWVLLRRGSDGLDTAPAFARYGASQAGAVLRYALAPASPLRPQAHLRLTRALVGNGESEAALGVSLRAPRGVPARLYGEGRVQRVFGETRVRPAAMLVSEVPPVALPLNAQAEVYAATGYVGGRDATPFFDAQVTADRSVATRGPADLRVGAGAWAGGQEGAARLDLGPRASLRVKIGEVPSRLALDWRFRVAGSAAPASGPALTLSAGF